ncbi:MAG: hypothetical protein O7H41_13545 [Planctomycetota bacterium]|nr:hypothetical protein [Planctomycetota bacterium]
MVVQRGHLIGPLSVDSHVHPLIGPDRRRSDGHKLDNIATWLAIGAHHRPQCPSGDQWTLTQVEVSAMIDDGRRAVVTAWLQ